MSQPTLPLSCRCGALRGSLQHPPAGIHVVCYCDDCQTYARALGPAGLLDAHGGTDIFQTSPAAIRLEAGAEQLGLMRLSPKGLFRWHSACCQTPVANTLGNPRMPFAGVVTAFIALSPEALREAVGPAVGIQGRFAIGGKPPGAHDTVPLSTLWQTGGLMLRGLFGGRHQPSPFFDPSTGQPRVTARVLSLEERSSHRPPG
jgi:hypothetical protein